MAKGDRFAVLTMAKQTGNAGGLAAHIDREVYDAQLDRMVTFRPKSVRDDSRTGLNRECIESAKKIGRTQAIWNRLKEEGFSRESTDKKTENKKTRKVKADAVIALCFICSSDEDTMKEFEKEGRLDEWIDATIDWFKKEFGDKNVVSVVLHMDETTPHLHITVVPITYEPPKPRKEKPKFDDDGKPIRKYETDEGGNIILDEKGRATVKKRTYTKQEVTARLSAKDICHPLAMGRWQTDYANAMAPFGLKRGLEGSNQKRVPPAEWNLQQVNGQLVAVEKEVEKQEAIKKANADAICRQEAVKSSNEEAIKAQDSKLAQAREYERKAKDAETQAKVETQKAQRKKDVIVSETLAVSQKLSIAKADLEKWGAILVDEKSVEYSGLEALVLGDTTFKELLSNSMDKIVDVIAKPKDSIFKSDKEWRKEQVGEVKAIISDFENTLFGENGVGYAQKKAIKELAKALYAEAKAKIATTIKENEKLKKQVSGLEAENKQLQCDNESVRSKNRELTTQIRTLSNESQSYKQSWEREKLAWDESGSPIKWKGGGQLSNKEYQKWLKEQFEKKKRELEAEQLARSKERDEHRKAQQAHKRHMKEIKDMISALFSLNFKKVIKIIIDHWKTEAKEFARDVMNELKSFIFGAESTTKGRKEYVSDAFVWAKVFAELDDDDSWKRDEGNLDALREDAMRIAVGTWEAYREKCERQKQRGQLLDSAVAALVEMGNNSYQRHLDQEQANAIEAFIDFDGGDRELLCSEIWDMARDDVSHHWREGTQRALEELRTGELYGQSYGMGR